MTITKQLRAIAMLTVKHHPVCYYYYCAVYFNSCNEKNEFVWKKRNRNDKKPLFTKYGTVVELTFGYTGHYDEILGLLHFDEITGRENVTVPLKTRLKHNQKHSILCPLILCPFELGMTIQASTIPLKLLGKIRTFYPD